MEKEDNQEKPNNRNQIVQTVSSDKEELIQNKSKTKQESTRIESFSQDDMKAQILDGSQRFINFENFLSDHLSHIADVKTAYKNQNNVSQNQDEQNKKNKKQTDTKKQINSTQNILKKDANILQVQMISTNRSQQKKVKYKEGVQFQSQSTWNKKKKQDEVSKQKFSKIQFMKRVYGWNRILQMDWSQYIQSLEKQQKQKERLKMKTYIKKAQKCFLKQKDFREKQIINNKLFLPHLSYNNYTSTAHENISLQNLETLKNVFMSQTQFESAWVFMVQKVSQTFEQLNSKYKNQHHIIKYIQTIQMILFQENEEDVEQKFMSLLDNYQQQKDVQNYCKEAAIYGAQQYPSLVTLYISKFQEHNRFSWIVFDFYLRVYLQSHWRAKLHSQQMYYCIKQAETILGYMQVNCPKIIQRHPSVSIFYFIKACIMTNLGGENKIIEEYATKALKLAESHYGEEQRQYYEVLFLLSQIKQKMGKLKQSKQLRKQAIRLAILAIKNPKALNSTLKQLQKTTPLTKSTQQFRHLFNYNQQSEKTIDDIIEQVQKDQEIIQRIYKFTKDGSQLTPLQVDRCLKNIYQIGFLFIYSGLLYITQHLSIFGIYFIKKQPPKCPLNKSCSQIQDLSCPYMHQNLDFLGIYKSQINTI